MTADQGLGGPAERPKRKPTKDTGPGPAPFSTNHSADSSSIASPVTGGGKSPALYQPLEPPITRSSLSELEVSKIINNLKLRHDINFDLELQFKPNVEGDMGQRKHDQASIFWTALKEQLVEFIVDRDSFDKKYGMKDDWCLPKLLKTIKDIVQTLVPQRNQQFLDEGLNVELLMQQFHNGTVDLEKLSLWLLQVLKLHCAPMRDKWVDSMSNQLSSGNRNNDVDELVNGMRSLLSLLEAMRLDVANHQIRCLRPALIQGTTAFEQEFLMEMLRKREVDISDAIPWYQNAARTYPGGGAPISSSFGDMGILFEGLSRSMLPSAGAKPLPRTFFFDDDRMRRIRSDILDAINLDVCMRMYEDLERETWFSTTPAVSNHASGDEPLMTSMINTEFNFNTTPSPSGPASLSLSRASFTSSFSRSSLILPSYVVPDMNKSKVKAHNLRDSLVALLQQAPHDHYGLDKWRSMAASMALQIFRFTNAPSEMIPVFEEKLTKNVCNITSPIFVEAEEAYRARLVKELATRVRYFKSLSQFGLFSIATGSQVPSSSRVLNVERDRDLDTAFGLGRQEGGIEDIATRIAHVGVVHWRIWGSIACVDGDYIAMDYTL